VLIHASLLPRQLRPDACDLPVIVSSAPISSKAFSTAVPVGPITATKLRAIPTPGDVLTLIAQQFSGRKLSLVFKKASLNPRSGLSIRVHRYSPKWERCTFELL
jgi:hypothetical protein